MEQPAGAVLAMFDDTIREFGTAGGELIAFLFVITSVPEEIGLLTAFCT